MADTGYEVEGQEMFPMRLDEGGQMDTAATPAEDSGVETHPLTDRVAIPLVGPRDSYLPAESLTAQATSLLVWGQRMGGPIGSLLRVAAHAIEAAVLAYEIEWGEFDLGPAPEYQDAPHKYNPGASLDTPAWDD